MLDSEALKPRSKRGRFDPKELCYSGRAIDHAVGEVQRGSLIVELESPDDSLGENTSCRVGAFGDRSAAFAPGDVKFQPSLFRGDHDSLDGVLELAHVSRPLVSLEPGGIVLRQLSRALELLGCSGEETSREQGDVLWPFSKGRYFEGEDAESVEEILTEAPPFSLSGQAPIRGC